ncbi:MAG: response regulator [Candidatus Electrothrix sp. ATG1]|nr:response regulator [Candidatus Electrothrix sp. ATG1]
MEETMSVLIVDDSRLSCVALRMRLSKRFPDWKIDEVQNAESALTKAEQKSYDLFTLDINMPGMSGLELAPILKEKYPAARIVFLTANIQDATRKRIEEMGAGFMSKPIKEDTVNQLIEAMGWDHA